MSSLSYMGYTLCDIAASNPFGKAAVGGAELCVSIRFALSAYAREQVTIGDVTARLSIKFAGEPAPRFIATAMPEAPINLKTQPASDPLAWLFCAFISTAQLAELETLRNGRGLIPIPCHEITEAEGSIAQLREHKERMAPGICVKVFQASQQASTICS